MKVTDVAGSMISSGTKNVLDASILSLEGIPVVACGSEKLYRDVSRLLIDDKN